MIIIDRMEGNYAICEKEDRTMVNIKIQELPKEAKEGDCIKRIQGKYVIDEEKTLQLKKEISRMMEDMWK